MSILNYELPTFCADAPVEHPLWCDPHECRVVDHRPGGLDLRRVHAVTLWSASYGRRLELIQTETLTDAGEVGRTNRPMLIALGDPGRVGLLADEAAALGEAWSRGAELAGRESLPVTPDGELLRVERLAERFADEFTGGVR